MSVLANFRFKLSSIRRLGFAATHLPQELLHFWEQVTSFANDAFCSGSSGSTTQRVTTKDAQLWVENLMEMDSELKRQMSTKIGHYKEQKQTKTALFF